MKIRYDEEKGIYRNCKFCGGEGCLACPTEADKAYREVFPDGPKPIATFTVDEPKELIRLRKACGKDALDKAFGPGGGGVAEIMENLNEYPPSK